MTPRKKPREFYVLIRGPDRVPLDAAFEKRWLQMRHGELEDDEIILVREVRTCDTKPSVTHKGRKKGKT